MPVRILATVGFFLAAATGLAADLQQDLERISGTRHLPQGSTGLVVYDITAQRERVALNPTALLIPASNEKLLVTAAALLELGPTFTFTTELYARGRIEDGILHGALILRGGGDPNLSERFFNNDMYAPMKAWTKAVKDAGIRDVKGPLIIDDSMFDQQFFHPSWPRNQAHKWYAAEVGALSLNDNCIELSIKPGKRGEKVKCTFEPFTNYITIRNSCETVAGSRANNIIIDRKECDVYVRGKLAERSRGYFTEMAVHDPGLFTGAVFGRKLYEQGIRPSHVERAAEPVNYRAARKLISFKSPDLKATIRVTNARSQNFYAEMLLKYLGYHDSKVGSFTTGPRAVERILTRSGYDFTGITMDDGGGLSRGNRVSARKIVELLRLMYMSRHRDEFVTSMAMPGAADGTLRKRLRGVKLKGKVYAKSGYLYGAKALSGYVLRDDGRVLVFSFIANRYKSSAEINKLQDKLMLTLANSPIVD